MTHGYEFKTNPVLEPLDNLESRDARITVDAVRAEPVEALWRHASIVIGKPPFLGGSTKRREWGDACFEALDTVVAACVPGGADLVCDWSDKACAAIETKGLGAAGGDATQSIPSGSNRAILAAIRKNTRICEAWSDDAWVDDAAAVRVSLVSFGLGECGFFNGERVDQITAELGSFDSSDRFLAEPLRGNTGIGFEASKKYSDFDVSGELARGWLRQPNPKGKPKPARKLA